MRRSLILDPVFAELPTDISLNLFNFFLHMRKDQFTVHIRILCITLQKSPANQGARCANRTSKSMIGTVL